MSSFQWKKKKQEKAHSAETKISSEPDSDTTQILELSSREFKVTLIHMLSTILKKVNNMQGYVI